MGSQSKKAYPFLAIGVLGASMSSMLVRFSNAPSAVLACYRLCITAILMGAFVLIRKETRRELFSLEKKTLLLCALNGVAFALHFVTWFESLALTTVASSTVIVCTEVIWVALFCRILFGERQGVGPILAIVVAIAGSVLIALGSASSGTHGVKGDLLSLLAAILIAISTMLARTIRKTTSTAVYGALSFFFSGITLLLLLAVRHQALFGYGAREIGIGALLAVVSTILGHTMYSYCLKFLPAPFVSAAKLCEPVIAAVLAALLFGEIPAALEIVGCVVVILSIVAYTLLQSRGIPEDADKIENGSGGEGVLPR